VQISRGPRDAVGKVDIEQEVLSQASLRLQIMPGDDVAK
jgi:hypothetical protein